MAARSRTSVGLSSRTYRRIPEPSSWKTPIVSPWPSSSNVFASSSGSVSTSSLTPRCFSTRSMASARIVRLMRPRKSNFRRPSASQACISNWVIVVRPSVARWSGMISVSGSREITIPAAWVEAWLRHPLELLRDADELVDPVVPRHQLAQLRGGLDGAVERDVQLQRDRLGDAIGLGVGQAHGAADVADGRLRAERPEGDDLRHAVVAVLARDVLDDLVAAASPGSRCRCPASSPGRG